MSIFGVKQRSASSKDLGVAVLRLQFWPKIPKANVSLQYTGQLNVCFMIQKRKFRKSHEDEHYVAVIF